MSTHPIEPVEPVEAVHSTTADEEVGVRPFALLTTLVRGRWTIVGVASAMTVGSIVYALLLSPVYTATTRFLPSRSNAIAGRMADFAGAGIAELSGGESASSDYYVDLLKSPAFLGAVVQAPLVAGGQETTLVQHYGVQGGSEFERVQRAVEVLQASMKVSVAKAVGGASSARVVTVDVSADQPQLAADIGQRLLDAIKLYNSEVRGGKASQNRTFIDAQLVDSGRTLQIATDAFADFTGRNRKIVTPDLTAEAQKLERAVRLQEQVVETLMKQLELAKIEEQENQPSIEVIQPPQPPLQRSAPARTRIVLGGGFLGLLLGGFLVLARSWFARLQANDPDAAEFKSALGEVRDELFRPFRRG